MDTSPDVRWRVGRGVTARVVLVSLVMMVGVIFWIHWAELVLGGRRGHTALANTSIPVGAFGALLVLTAVSALLNRVRQGWGLRQPELLTCYAILAVSTVLSSSGAIHFLVPGVASAFYFASPANKWELFQPYVPSWFAPREFAQLRPFFEGGSPIVWQAWLVPTLVWTAFIFVYALATLALSAIVRAQWIEHERLTFPTVVIPLSVTDLTGGFWRNRLAWIGMAIPFAIGTLNTLHVNYPSVPNLEVRYIDLSASFRERPWSAMGGLQLSLYPFVVGIAFLLSSEVTFSCWFFFLVEKAERVIGASLGLDQWGQSASSKWPFEGHQGAGAFIALTSLALYIGRRQLAVGLSAIWHGRTGEEVPRWALGLLVVCVGALVAFCSAAGMNIMVALALLALSLIYMTAAARIRSETGNAWLFGPRIDPHTLLVSGLGAKNYSPRDLTVMAYLASISSWDLRCASMPHQLDAFKLASLADIDLGSMVKALVLGLAVGIPVGWVGALKVWHHVGALAKGEPWRVNEGRRPFEMLASYLAAPQAADYVGLGFVALGFAVTVGLFALRTRLVSWPLHPVGYAISGTPSMQSQWFPFLLAWAAKTALLKYGGHKAYRQALPFFVGMVVGDLLNGALYTLIACFAEGMHVYPINW
ncbi:MAG: DUF6785 family protein [Armatimonadota bacterium]